MSTLPLPPHGTRPSLKCSSCDRLIQPCLSSHFSVNSGKEGCC
jgi:hypothetical protein